MGETPRLLLLELVGKERWVHNSRFFPFIKGGAEKLGLEVRWLCFGARTRSEKTGAAEITEHYDLSDRDLSVLEDEVKRFEPTHVAVSDPISQAAIARLSHPSFSVDILSLSRSSPRFLEGEKRIRRLHRAATGEALQPRGLGATNPSSPRPYDTAWIQSRTDWLLTWLDGRSGRAAALEREAFLVDACDPSYKVRMANDEARDFEPFIIIMGGVSCDHFAQVSDNAFYQGLDLSKCPQQYGCGYCTHYRGAVSDLTLDPVEVAKRQLERVHETAGDQGRSCWQFEVYDVRLFRKVESFFNMVMKLDLPPSTFWFEPRIDRFLEVSPELDRVMPRLEGSGHVIGVLRMGAENLVDEENLIFNKSITLGQIDGARRVLVKLADEHEGAFVFDPTFGYITCSPWTKLEMLEEGIDKAIERGFAPDDIWLYTPLLLYNGSPMTVAAERDGNVLTEAFEDVAMLYEAAINHVDFSTVKPWRFRDERVGLAFGLIVRFYAAVMRQVHPDTIFEGDELYDWLIDEFERRDGPFDTPDCFAREVIALVRTGGPARQRQELMSLALDRSTRRRKLHDLAEAVTARFRDRLGGVSVIDLRIDGADIVLNVMDKTVVFRIRLCQHDTVDEEISRSEHWSVAFDDSRVGRGEIPSWLEGLVAAVDLAIKRLDPSLFSVRP